MNSLFQKNVLVALFLAFLALSGQRNVFAQSFGQFEVPQGQARMDLNVRAGVVLDIQVTRIEVKATQGTRTAGAAMGGLLGAIAGRNQDWAARASIAAIGGLIGERVANYSASEWRDAMQVIVMLEDGRKVGIVQEMTNNLQPGDTVFLVGQGEATRAVKAPAYNAQPVQRTIFK